MTTKSPLLRTGLACGLAFGIDFVLKEVALLSAAHPVLDVLPAPGSVAAAEPVLFAYEAMRGTALVLGANAPLPNAGLALFSLVVASIFVAAALASHLFLPERLKAWPVGLGLAAGGFFANAVDRALHGDVMNVFALNMSSVGLNWLEAAFNFADLSEILGACFLIFGLLRAMNGDWNDERRKHLIIERTFQIRYCWYLQAAMTIGFLPMFFSALVIFQAGAVPIAQGLIALFVGISIAAYIALSVVAWSVGMYLSHRTAGPILKFSKVAVQRLNGTRPRASDPGFSFREKDEFKIRLENVMREIDRFTAIVDRLTKKPAAERARRGS